MTDVAQYQQGRNGPLTPETVKFLNEVRLKNSWSYKDVGERLGISQAFIYNLLNKGQNISTDTYLQKVGAGIDRLKAGELNVPVWSAPQSAPGTMRENRYHLRDNIQISINLPVDLTEREAERLSLFIRSLAK